MIRLKGLFSLLCTIMLMAACATQLPIVVKEGGQTIVQLQGARFIVPPGFTVQDVIQSNPREDYTESTVIMGKSENEDYTVIVFSAQAAYMETEFVKMDLKENYADTIFIDNNLDFLYNAASYITRMPLSRKMYLEKPLCMVVTGYQYEGLKTRFRFDIYRNLTGQDPLRLAISGQMPDKKGKALTGEPLRRAKIDLKAFRKTALSWIKNNTRWP